MTALPVLLLALSAAPSAPVKLAAPGLGVVNVAPAMQAFVADHLNQELVLAGVDVVSAAQIGAVLGLERQKQLVGCTETSSSCLAELANALGVDGLVLGSFAKLGTSFQLDVRVASASDARNLAIFSTRIADENGILDATAQAAHAIAGQLAKALNRSLVPVAQAQVKSAPLVLETRNSPTRNAGKWTLLISSAVLVTGVVLAVVSDPNDPHDVRSPLGGLGFLLGAGGVLVGGGLYLFGGTEQVPVKAAVVPTRDGWLLGVSGRF